MDFFTTVNLLLLVEASGAESAAVGTGSVSPPHGHQVASLGSSLTLNCSFDHKDGVDRIRVNWLLSKTPHFDCQDQTLKKLSTGLANQTMQQETWGNFVQVTRNTWSSLTLRDVASHDDGWYFCQVVVEIPGLQKSCINVTQVIIITPPSPPLLGNVGWWLSVAVVAGSLMLLAVIVRKCILYRRKRCRSTENPIYESMHPVFKNNVLSQHSPQTGMQANTCNMPPPIDLRTLTIP